MRLALRGRFGTVFARGGMTARVDDLPAATQKRIERAVRSAPAYRSASLQKKLKARKALPGTLVNPMDFRPRGRGH